MKISFYFWNYALHLNGKKVIAKQFTKGLLQSEFLKIRSILHKTQTLAQLMLSISEIFLLVSIFFGMIHELFLKKWLNLKNTQNKKAGPNY